jgi:hypothetical protein
LAREFKPFDRETLEKAFGRLGQMTREAGKAIEISVYGGSALLLTFDFRVATRDVDAVFDTDHAFVRRAANVIADEFGWPPNWINDGVKGFFLSHHDSDPAAKALFRSYPTETGPGLRVFVASPDYLFAMKSLAMRAGGAEPSEDIEDIRKLGVVLGVKNAADALAIVSRYYPEQRLPPKTKFGLEEIFGAATKRE